MATIDRTDRNSTGGWFFAAVMVVGLLLILGPLIRAVSTGAIPLPQQPPPREIIIETEHAVLKHGADAIEALRAVKLCPSKDVRYRLLNGTAEGIGWVYWCEWGGPLCPCVYVTMGGTQKTAYIRPCEQLRNPKKGRGEW